MKWTKWLVGLSPILVIICFVCMAAGHGTAVPIIFIFPIQSLLVFEFDSKYFFPIMFSLALVQAFIYGVIIDHFRINKPLQASKVKLVLLIVHLLIAIGIFLYLQTQNFF